MELCKEARMFVELLDPKSEPGALIPEFDAFGTVYRDPIARWLGAGRVKGGQWRDRFGTLRVWPEGSPGAMPHVTDDDKACPDVTEWRKYVKIPDLAAECSAGWEDVIEEQEAVREKGKLSLAMMATGIFEQCHYLMGFEDTFINLLEEPEAMHELVDAIAEFRFTYAKMIADNLHPDAIISHDDWGSKQALFMPPDTWREFFKPHYERIYGYLHDSGIYVLHHSDSYCQSIVEDMIDCHIDVWQGVLPTNDIPAMQVSTAGRIVFMGGIDSVIDRADQTEEEIRAEVRRCCDAYGPGGHFIPSLTYGGKDAGIFPLSDSIAKDEIRCWNRDHGFEE